MMKANLKTILSHIFLAIAGLSLFSCTDDAPAPAPIPDPTPPLTPDRTILLYAVAANSLNSNLDSDMEEIRSVADQIADNKTRIVVYSAKRNRLPALLELKGTGSEARFDTVAKYSLDESSISPDRLSNVVKDVRYKYKSNEYGLILWSHSTAWLPAKKSALFWFGQDMNTDPVRYGNIPEIAAALPDHFFSFIWFDSCYMANIETAFQFRNKCDTYIGYTTEIWSDGMPYQLTMPLISQKTPDFAKALEVSKNYYGARAYTGCVVDMKHIEALAKAAKPILTSGPALSSKTGLLSYSRSISPILYDFGQVTTLTATQNGVDEQTVEAFSAALDECVAYKICSEYNFSNRPIDPNIFSGLSTHIFDVDEQSETSNFYRTFDWYKEIYE